MSQTQSQQPQTGLIAIRTFLNSDGVTAKFQELLGKKSTGFITNVLQLCAQNKMLANCEPTKVYQAAAMAAMLDLPLNPNLGYAYIIPYNEKTGEIDPSTGKDIYKPVPQFQMGYKGFVQLAQRSGQFANINVTDVREGEIKRHDRLTGAMEFEWDESADRPNKKIIGFVGYFKLLNGFEKVVYKTVEELHTHGKRYSKTYNQSSSKWKSDFEAMSLKTLIKLMLSKYAPLSIEMQTATIADQAVINKLDEGVENAEFQYVDNDGESAEIDLDNLLSLYDLKKDALSKDEKADAERIMKGKEETSYNKLFKLLQNK